jgi:hypothetical protein
MEDFVLDVSVRGEDFGKNLIASALPKDAPFSRFSPNPTGSVQAAPNIAAAPTQSVDTRGRKRPARVAADAPPPIDVNDPVHHEKTVIADRRLPPRPPGAPAPRVPPPPRVPPGPLPPPRSPLPKR